MIRRLFLIALVLGFACGGGSDRKETPEAALATLKSILQGTAAAIASGLQTRVVGGDHPDPGACVGTLGNDKGTVTFDYQIDITPRQDTDFSAMAEAARAHWEAAGYDVGKVGLAPDPSARSVTARRDGYGVALHTGADRIVLAGSTPCIKDPSHKAG